MTESERSPIPHDDDEIDIRELIRVVWAGKWLITGITAGATIVAVIIALMLPNIYRAEALLAPNDQESSGGLSALAAQYGGLASLAGINLGTGGADKTGLSLEILKSRRFISEFIERHNILVPLIAAEGWDPASDELKLDESLYNNKTGEWTRTVGWPRKVVPSSQEAYQEFMKILSVSQDKKSSFVRLAVESYSPTTAKQWVDWIVADLNTTIMKQDIDEAEQAIEYLNKQIQATSLAGLKDVFFNLIEEQTKTVMLAKVSQEYMFRTIDPAIAPELKAKPKRSLIAALGLFFGGAIGVIVVLVMSGFSSERKQIEPTKGN